MRRLAKCYSGALWYPATIRTPSATTDGETKKTWSTLASNVPTSREHTGGNEVVKGDQVVSMADERIRMIWRADVTTQMRLRYATTGTDDVLEIVSAGDESGTRQWLTIRANKLEST